MFNEGFFFIALVLKWLTRAQDGDDATGQVRDKAGDRGLAAEERTNLLSAGLGAG